MEDFARARYGLLGQAGHWFPGMNADGLDREVSEAELIGVLSGSPWQSRIPDLLRRLRDRLQGATQQRLSSA